MFGSDVLDAAAIGAGAALLGGIIAGLFSYLTTLSNNKAKRSEIAFEKRLDAFKHISTAISRADETITKYVLFKTVFKTSEDIQRGIEGGLYPKEFYGQMENRFSMCKREFAKVYHDQKVYLPPVIDKMIQVYMQEVLYEPVQIQDYNLFALQAGTFVSKEEYLEKIMKIKDRHANEVLSEMRRFIGYN